MPWQERDTVSIRLEFVQLARQKGVNMRELCRRFEISPKTGYKWLERYAEGGGAAASLVDLSRRPHSSPQRSCPDVEKAVVELRSRHPAWGGRKIARRLTDKGREPLAPSTVTSILHRHGLIDPKASQQAAPVQRFEHEQPNALWQMDFKGDFKTLAGWCRPLTVLDDHSRFNLALKANARTTAAHIQPQLEAILQRYGMPVRINVDNGPPWGGSEAVEHGLTALTVWLIRLGITVSHSRPHRPQTNGKIERFHRTLDDEVIAGRHYADHQQVQGAFDRWRRIYNFQRPHEALLLDTPIHRYRPSLFRMPGKLPEIHYRSDDLVLKVAAPGSINFRGRKWRVARALAGLEIALRPNPEADGCFDLYFCHQRFAGIDLNHQAVDS
jgi:transposase InsO family protein